MSSKRSQLECIVCRKHRGELPVPGGPLYRDALVYVGHAFIPQEQERVYLGWLLVEPRRHVPTVAELTAEEASAVGLWVSRAGRALKEVVAAEHVYVFVLGHHASHLHVHVLPRYPGTPHEYWGLRVDEWPAAPRGDLDEVTALAERLRSTLADYVTAD
jgi:diadenosine tetraphosphate (Ap4A) HIT family hydrolase